MDDRFHNEELEAAGKYPVGANEKKTSLGDFSENIDSNGGAEPTVAPRFKKFEVHIPDIDQDPIVEAPEYKEQTATPAPAKKRTPARVQNSGNNSRKRAASTPSRQRRSVSAPRKSAPESKNNKAVKSTATKRYDFIKNLLISCVCFIFVAIITASVSTVAIGFINDILVISDDSEFSAVVEIPEGATYDEVFDILCDEGLVRQPFLTDFFLRFRNYDKVQVWNSETSQYEEKLIKYEPGMYYLNYSDGIENMIESIMVKTNYARDTVRLTFPEGWSIPQIFEKLEKYGVCEAEKLYANLDIIGKQYDFVAEIEADGGRYLTCEGYLFPDTYDFFVGEAPSSVLKKLFNNFESKWSDDYTERLEELGMTMDEVIIIASIIQREAKDGSQMKDISSVIHNRLSDSVNFPNIQMNSTTDYITGIKQFNLFSDSYFALYLDKYNTYKVMGLPPGAICNPGKTAINAALYPSDTNYYFFCHDKSGNVYYAATAQEHAQNTSKVLYG